MLDYEMRPDYRFVKFNNIKPGSKLIVKSSRWYEENEDGGGDGDVRIGAIFVPEMKDFCGKIVTVTSIKFDTYETSDSYIYEDRCDDANITIKEDDGCYTWSLGMFQGMICKKSLGVE